jgi:hypothetical protein
VAAPNPDKLTTHDVSCSGRGTASQSGCQTDWGATPLQERAEGCSVQNTATCLLTITGIGVPLLSGTTPVPEGHYPHTKIAEQQMMLSGVYLLLGAGAGFRMYPPSVMCGAPC